MTTLSEWIEGKLKPEIFKYANKVYPQLFFESCPKGWRSSKNLEGEDAATIKRDRIVLYSSNPYSVLENGEGSPTKDTITLYQDLNHYSHTKEGRLEAIKSIAELLDLELPDNRDPEQIKKWEEAQARQNEIEKSLSRQKKALHSAEGKEVLNYLLEKRGYSFDFIKWAEFGFISPSEAETLGELFKYTSNGIEKKGITPYGAQTHPFSIPQRTKGKIYGFKFRVIGEPKEGDSKYYNMGGISKSRNLFGLTGLTVSAKDRNSQNLIVVEGELDCLAMQYHGFNAAASLGGEISRESLLEAKARGVKSLTLLYDKDQAGNNFTERTIRTAKEIEMAVYIAELPGTSKDPDSFFFKEHHTKEEMEEVVTYVDKGASYLAKNLVEKYAEEHKGEEITLAMLDPLREEIIDLAVDLADDQGQWEIFEDFRDAFPGAPINPEVLRKIAEKKQDKRNKEKQEKATKELQEKFTKLVGEGKTEEALELIKEESQLILGMRHENEFINLLKPTKRSEVIEAIKEEGDPLETSYTLGWVNQQHKGEEIITIPTGAVTLVCAPTGHGKSTFLRNFTLDILEHDKSEGDILYFTYEESREDVICQFINTYYGKEIHQQSSKYKQVDTIKQYYKTGSTKYFKDGVEESFRAAEKKFFKEYIETGKLRPIYKDYDITTLLRALQYFYDNVPKVKAIFIDYVQLLRKTGSKLTRQDELQEISTSLNAFAVKTKLPIVLAAQLNREASTPLRMTNQNLSESSYLEKSANTILCCWNSNSKPPYGRNSVGAGEEQTEITHLENDLGFKLGEAGKLFVKQTKRRGGASEIYGVFDFKMELGKIFPNKEIEEAKKEASEGSSQALQYPRAYLSKDEDEPTHHEASPQASEDKPLGEQEPQENLPF